MSEDEKLVHAVAQAVLSSRRSSGVERPGQVAAETIRMAMAAIAAVRAWDAEQGLVTVPRGLLGSVQAVMNPLSGFLKRQREGGPGDRYLDDIRGRVRNALATPAPQSDGEA